MLAAIIMAAPALVRAESTEFELFDPNAAPEAGFMLESPYLIPGLFTVGTYMQIQGNPVTIARPDGNSAIDSAVSYRWQQRFVGTVSILKYAQVSADLPVTLLSGQRFGDAQKSRVTSLNDLVFRARAPFYEFKRDEHKVKLAASGSILFPTGDENNFGGTSGRFAQPSLRILSQYDYRRWFVRGTLGWAERDETEFTGYDLTINDRFLYRASAGYLDKDRRTYFAELAGSSQFTGISNNAVELYGGVELRWGDFAFIPGAAMGLTKAFGVPGWRLMAGFFYQPGSEKNRKRILKPFVWDGDVGYLKIAAFDSESLLPVSHATVGVRSFPGVKKTRTDDDGIAMIDMPPGPVTVTVSSFGYVPGATDANVAAFVTSEVLLDLQKIDLTGFAENPFATVQKLPRVQFSITDDRTSQPISAGTVLMPELSVEDSFTGGKWGLILDPGAHRVSVGVPGYYPYEVTFGIKPGEAQDFDIQMTPIIKEEKIVVTSQRIYISEKINFQIGSYRILNDSFYILDGLAETMLAHDEIKKVLIKGHTDSRGNRLYNLKLSKERAGAVKQYLMDKGVQTDRLESEGYGPDQPIATNDTAEGRSLNRRVDFDILDQGAGIAVTQTVTDVTRPKPATAMTDDSVLELIDDDIASSIDDFFATPAPAATAATDEVATDPAGEEQVDESTDQTEPVESTEDPLGDLDFDAIQEEIRRANEAQDNDDQGGDGEPGQ